MKNINWAGFSQRAFRMLCHCLLAIGMVLICYCAGWMLAGVSGMILSPVATSITGNDYSREFLHTFPIGGKVVGVLIGLWFAIIILKN